MKKKINKQFLIMMLYYNGAISNYFSFKCVGLKWNSKNSYQFYILEPELTEATGAYLV